MPGALTVDTSPIPPSQPPRRDHESQQQPQSLPQPQTQTQTPQASTSRSTSPAPAPPYSPITPTRRSPTYAYTHASQPNQTENTIPQPPPIPLDFEDNSDVIALRSAIAILQMQARNAGSDVRRLRDVKERALRDPEAFLGARERGEVRVRDGGFGPSYESEDEDDDEDSEPGMKGEHDVKMDGEGRDGSAEKKGEEWLLPRMQNVVRCPPINWSQYAVMGESLDKIHKDQLDRPVEGTPQRIGPDGNLIYGGEGERREHVGVYAPYDPMRDKVEVKKKNAKR